MVHGPDFYEVEQATLRGDYAPEWRAKMADLQARFDTTPAPDEPGAVEVYYDPDSRFTRAGPDKPGCPYCTGPGPDVAEPGVLVPDVPSNDADDAMARLVRREVAPIEPDLADVGRWEAEGIARAADAQTRIVQSRHRLITAVVIAFLIFFACMLAAFVIVHLADRPAAPPTPRTPSKYEQCLAHNGTWNQSGTGRDSGDCILPGAPLPVGG